MDDETFEQKNHFFVFFLKKNCFFLKFELISFVFYVILLNVNPTQSTLYPI